jgi:hypothetical protein
MGGIIDKHLAKLADGRTEITTDMICEAERIGYKDNLGCGLIDYYTNVLKSLSKNEIHRSWEHQMNAMALAQQNYTYAYRCPYCGK